MRNIIANQTRNNKKAYYTKYFNENSKNARKLWAGIN